MATPISVIKSKFWFPRRNIRMTPKESSIKVSILENGYSWTFYSLGHILELNLGSLAGAGLGNPLSFLPG